MKTTIEIPDDLLRQTKATAALAGETLKQFVTTAIQDRLDRDGGVRQRSRGWRSVFGLASREETDGVDAIVEAELEQVDPRDWR